MTRWPIAALLALNLALLAWNLASFWPWGAEGRRDALRSTLQVRPEAVQVVPAEAASAAAAPAPSALP